MFLKVKIKEIFKNLQHRYFSTTTMSKRVTKLVQFHSGNEDFCPLKEHEGLCEYIGNNHADGVVFAWRDNITRKSNPGEKRIYACKLSDGAETVVGEIYLKNDGDIEISADKDLKIKVLGDCSVEAVNVNVKASAGVNVNSPVTNLGTGGKGIARLDDEVEVTITSGDSAGTWKGKITGSGVNTSI